mgnify:CR=1 FL=1
MSGSFNRIIGATNAFKATGTGTFNHYGRKQLVGLQRRTRRL